jgi:hypothetical protein
LLVSINQNVNSPNTLSTINQDLKNKGLKIIFLFDGFAVGGDCLGGVLMRLVLLAGKARVTSKSIHISYHIYLCTCVYTYCTLVCAHAYVCSMRMTHVACIFHIGRKRG